MKYYHTFVFSADKEYNDYLYACRLLEYLRIHFTAYSDVDDDDNNDVYCIEVNIDDIGGNYEL